MEVLNYRVKLQIFNSTGTIIESKYVQRGWSTLNTHGGGSGFNWA